MKKELQIAHYFFILIACWKVNILYDWLNKTLLKWFHLFLFCFFNVIMGKFWIKYVAHVLFLLSSADLE